MSKINYPLDYYRPVKPPTNRPLRLAVLGIAVAAVTCGAVWFFRPKEGKKADNDTAAPVTESLSAVEQIVAPAENSTAAVEIANPEVEAAPAQETAKAEEIEVAAPEVLPGTAEKVTVSAEPEKGKVHATDLPPEQDLPLTPADVMPEAEFAAAFVEMERLFAAGNHVEVRNKGEALLKMLSPYSPQWRKSAALLGRANVARLFAGRQDGREIHVVAKGESLYVIARKYGLSINALRKMNNMPEDKTVLWIGDKLVVGHVKWHIKVGKKVRLLELYDRNRLFAVYDIGVGRAGKTPAGVFTIGDRIVNPPYHAPDGRIIAPGAPENELGTRFLKLIPSSGAKAEQGYGIHGTADESTVGRSLSSGCIRMRNAAVEELFTIVPNGTKVEISE